MTSGFVCTRTVIKIVVAVSSFVLLEAAASVTGPVSFDYGTFVSEYIRIESSSITNWYKAVDACRAYGTGWDIAGIYSSGGNTALGTLGGNQPYFGGYCPSPSIDVAPYILLWYGGRFRGTPISKGKYPSTTTCLGPYCHYDSSQPDSAYHNSYYERALVLRSNGKWNDLAPEYDYDINNVLCERSACSIQVDCVTANTASISGVYAPSCTCTCKTG